MKRILLFIIALMAVAAMGPSPAFASDPNLDSYQYTTPCATMQLSGYTCHFVSNAGSDSNAGTEASPWQTVSKINSEQANWNGQKHAVFFKRGDYWNESLTVSMAGPLNSYNRMGSYGDTANARPKIGGTSHSNCITVTRGPVLLTDLHADDCSWAGLQVDNANVSTTKPLILLGDKFSNNRTGVHVGYAVNGTTNAPAVQISGSSFINNNKYQIESGSDNDSGAWGVLVNGDDVTIDHNYFEGQRYVGGDYGTDGASIEQYRDSAHISGSSSIKVWSNLSVNDDTFIEDFSWPTTSINFTAEENFIYGDVSNQKAFVVITGSGNKVMQRNTIRFTGGFSGSSAHQFAVNCSSCDQFDNNIVHVSGTDKRSFFTNTPSVVDYNIFKPASYCATNPCGGTNQENVDPLLTSATDPHLTSTSPAIDAGDPTYTYCCITTDRDSDQRDSDGSGTTERQSIGADEYVP